ncbi:MAG: hypothetical protein NC122_05545 [Faecalibacterium sp.]|nr:hypothetical protein [Ruminococcus sp.]MCM1392892.1 hypothetical protein [Ruminococcus sp.]MCM1485651.1 hypothetical protein [Faecalibacterium sp.]
MISDKEFLDFLNDDTFDSSLEEKLKDLLDKELEKSENEMDTDLVERCLDELLKLEAEKQAEEQCSDKIDRIGDDHRKIKTHRLKRVLLAAAMVVVLAVGAVSVSAVIPNMELFNGTVEVQNGHVLIHFNDEEDKSDDYKLCGSELLKELNENGFSSVSLPEVLLTDDCEVSEIEYKMGDLLLSSIIKLSLDNETIIVQIDRHKNGVTLGDMEYLSASTELYKLIIDGISVYIIEQENVSTITYRKDDCEYSILTPFDVEKAKNFAKTIK